jgi:hypothetical protein
MANTLKVNSSGEGRYFIFDSKNGFIEYNDFSEVEQILVKYRKVYLKNKSKDGRPIWFDYFTTIAEIIKGYQSQLNRQQKRKLAREDNKYFKKAETNRMKNQKSSKKIDNLRYLFARAARVSSVNFFPAGFYGEDGIINFLDRGNVSEEQAATLKTDGGTYFKKTQFKTALNEILENLGDDTPIVVKDWIKKVDSLSSTKEYSLFEIIGQDGFDSILNEIVNIKVMISSEVQSVNEMVNFNGKNNPWVFLHFMFQYLDIRNNFNNDAVFVKLSEKGKYLSLKDYIGYKEGENDVPEILPALPTITTIVSNNISKFDWENSNDDERIQFKDKLKKAYIAFDSFKSTGQDKVKSFYDTFINKTDDYEELHLNIEKCAKVLDKIVQDNWWDTIITKWKELLVAIEHVANDSNQTELKQADAKTYVKARFGDVMKGDMQDLINTIAISIHDAKFTLESTSYSNIEQFFTFLQEEFISGITIETNGVGEIIDYEISNDEVRKLLTSQKASSWDKKLELVYPFIQRAVLKTKQYIGTDKNHILKQKEVSFFKKVSILKNDCWWMESDINGEMVQVGMVDGKLTSNSSWQHLEDDLNKWEIGCIEEITTNAASKRTVKPNKMVSYKRKLENVVMFYESKKITEGEYDFSKLSLNAIISGLEKINK